LKFTYREIQGGDCPRVSILIRYNSQPPIVPFR